MRKYDCIFTDTLGCTSNVVHDVEVGDQRPIKQHPYRLGPGKAQIVRDEVKYMLDNDLIEPSQSPWSSPVLLVPKSDGTFRMCQDFRKINSVTKSCSYPLPRIEDCIDLVGGSRFVSKIDLMKGYWQVPLTERAKEISAFATPEGLWQNKRMPFGMKNACATFQSMMNQLTTNLNGCVAYIDDILVCHDSWEEHLSVLEQLFERLANANLTVNLAKSEFGKARVEYLGHIVGRGEIRPRDAKIQAVKDFPEPKRAKDILSFLGLMGFYRRFCPNMSEVAEPLTALLKKGVKFVWDQRCTEAFQTLKNMLTCSPVLHTPDFSRPFQLEVDASDLAVGAVLVQTNDSGERLPVSYFSRKLNKHQLNYATIEKEALALLLALQHFQVYVGNPGVPVKVYTDHNPLVFIAKMRNQNRRLLRWSLCLQEYDIEIEHLAGKKNIVADSLSRIGFES